MKWHFISSKTPWWIVIIVFTSSAKVWYLNRYTKTWIKIEKTNFGTATWLIVWAAFLTKSLKGELGGFWSLIISFIYHQTLCTYFESQQRILNVWLRENSIRKYCWAKKGNIEREIDPQGPDNILNLSPMDL